MTEEFREGSDLTVENGFADNYVEYRMNCKRNFGAEDITILDDRLAFISTGLKYPGMTRYTDGPGKIYVLNLPSIADPTELQIKGDFDAASFGPHGISIYTDEKDGSRYLFVVNHPHENSQIEIFQYIEEENTLLHLKTIKHKLLHNVNDIVAVGVENFFATNDHYFTNEPLKLLEALFSLHWCNVVYYSPEVVQVVAGGFFGANGVNMSPDKKHLYVSDLMNHRIVVLNIQKDNTLSRVKEVDVGSLCDNIEVERKTGDLWMGCHPNGGKVFLNDLNDPPGSEVIRIQHIHTEEPVVTLLCVNDYETLSTTGVILALIMFITGILIALNPVLWNGFSLPKQKYLLSQYRDGDTEHLCFQNEPRNTRRAELHEIRIILLESFNRIVHTNRYN
ncbi:Serum paraoxonase/arylesterase 2 [Bagarius yarrelli]|uniref:Paraoxonase n=1 Tax=Bagarius yarrelli TaxID=175774 RepID=A0A556TZ19_BAGYA|nr:Serum paraoxonase/arylesterase 2 [Bagarius yarrelli]